MLKLKHFVLSALSTALLAATGANAGSVLGDEFKVDSVEASLGGAGIQGVGTAGTPVFGADATSVLFPVDFAVAWIDGDTFGLTIRANVEFVNGANPDLADVTITLSDLDFKDGGNPVAITKATFNAAASVNSFFGYLNTAPDNATGSPPPGGPTVTWTDKTVVVNFTNFTGQLIGDQTVTYYDVQTAVPEPGTVALLLLGIGGISLVRRRGAQRSA